ncbi:MAG: hypothetical protein WBB67_11415 [bacterium]
MNKWYIFAVLGLFVLLSVCSKKEFSVIATYTCPQGKEVKHGGFYKLLSTEDSVSMYGYTPSEYALTMKEGDTLTGCCWKDTTSYPDTLRFEIYADGVQEIDYLITTPNFEAEFTYVPIDSGS